MASTYASYSMPPPSLHNNSVQLPSIKQLDLYKPSDQQGSSQQSRPSQSEHGTQQSAHSGRHENASWGRNALSNPQSQSHSPSMPPPPEPSKSHHASHKSEGVYHSQQSGGAGTGSGRSDAVPPQNAVKRGRTEATISASPGRSPHTSYPPYSPQHQQPPSGYHQVQGGPPPQQQQQEQVPQGSPYPQPGGYPYPPSHHVTRGPYPGPPTLHAQHPHAPAGNPYSPSGGPPDQWQPPPPTSAPGAPPAPQPGYEGVVRTTPIVPATIETRNAHSAHPINPLERRHGIIQQIVQHCNTLWGFANKYAQTPPHMQPHPDELRDMHYFAGVVVHLLDDLRRLSLSEEQGGREGLVQVPSADESRPPKRPWEDMSRDDDPAAAANQLDYPDENSQTTAEQDMEIIRSKRATSSGTTTPGQPKSKYRKRSRATPPGKCSSCNIRETPEWRRGPDGARTLCNACGLHYAKLQRKKDKQLGPDGKPVVIDLAMLRASTASARGHHHRQSSEEPNHSQPPPTPPPQQHQSNGQGVSASPYEPSKQPMHPQHSHQQPALHGAPYQHQQLQPVPAQGPLPASGPQQMMHSSSHPPSHEHPPTPSWSSGRGFPSEQPYGRPPSHSSHIRQEKQMA